MSWTWSGWAARVVRAVARLLPASLRDEYGDEMLDVFTDRLDTVTTEQGRVGGALYVIRTVINVIAEAVASRTILIAEMLHACGQPGLAQDLRQAVRSLARAWGFTCAVVCVLGTGLGLTAAVFSVAYAILLRPFPYQSPGALVRIDWMASTGQSDASSLSDLEIWKQARRSLADIGAYSQSSVQIRDRGPADTAQIAYVGSRTLAMLGVQPQLGRLFSDREDIPNGDVHKAILSHALWVRVFGQDPLVVGRVIQGGDGPLEIVGVMPPGFGFPNRADLWAPIESMWARSPSARPARMRSRIYAVVARLSPGLTAAMARAELQTLAETVVPRRTDAAVRVRSLRDAETADIRSYLIGLLAATACLLLICLMNVSSLQLARGLARRHEFALRAAIGASVSRNLRTQLVESMVLACTGAALAVVVARTGVRLFTATIPVPLPDWVQLELNPVMLASSFVLGAAAAVLAGLVPAWRALRQDPQSLLRSGRGATDRAWLRKGFVVAEIALSTTLLLMAGLAIATLLELQHREAGFRPDGVLTVQIARAQPGSAADRIRTLPPMHARVMETLAAIPGVTSVAGSNRLPLTAGSGSRTIVDLNITGASGGTAVRASFFGSADVTPDYFATMGIPLVRGRYFTAHDAIDSARVVIVNERAAGQLWPGQDPLGQQAWWGTRRPDNPPATVVGVVRNLRAFAAEGDAGLDFYYPYAQYPANTLFYVLRASVDPDSLVEPVRRAIQTTEPSIAVSTIKTMSRRIQESLWQTRLWSWLLALFAGSALVLSVAGLYALVSYLVGLRSKEFGIRMSLGATGERIAGLLLGEMLRLVAAGAVLGIAASLATSRLIAALLIHVSPTDVRLYVAVPVLVAIVAVVACCPPVLRSRRLDLTRILNS
jgi:predicted permease